MGKTYYNDMKQLIPGLLYVCLIACMQAQPIHHTVQYEEEDVHIFETYLTHIIPYVSESPETLLKQTALFFLEKPYTANTLEVTDDEMLVVNLREFDCMTFVETVIALAQVARGSRPTFEKFTENLRHIRYRNGIIQDYSSRLHYTTDWLFENEARGALRNLTPTLPGHRTDNREINFMSTNRHLYQHLANDDTMLAKIVAVENNMNKREGFSYLPTAQIIPAQQQIPNMAVVAFTTSISGLDVQHVGFSFWENNRLTFVHASTSTHSVIIDNRTIAEYCEAMRTVTGVIVAKVVL